MSAFQKQIDGSHYTDLVIQPIELAYLVANGDAGFCKLAKYLLRNKGERITNLEKAKHIVELTHEIYVAHSLKFPELPPQSVKILQAATGTLDINQAVVDQREEPIANLGILSAFLSNEFQMCRDMLDEIIEEVKTNG